ncbi:suppressor of tumorigenicity 14 protein homolog isoform X2 [Pristis pectinata]|uniref:suppressor of tumorigenicity 14 protein homolog isoform X2 n=1 Tax=Pristis pectinata TaxID=685728 RepID=UPI00223D169B|nr:suppressor of tumorigenicity 14 protein homolog isoform X2 [Pristis pectinata]
MTEPNAISMVMVSDNSEQAAQTERFLVGPAEQPENNRCWRRLTPTYKCKRDICNKIICWKCKMWMLIVSVATLIAAIIIIVILSIRATPLDDEFIDPKLKTHGIPRYYIGSMKISKYSFTPELMMPQSKNFTSLSNTLKIMLKQVYTTSPALGYYFVDSDIFSFSHGSVIAYYWLQFALPEEQDLLIKYTLSIEVLINILRQHLHTADVRRIMEIEPSSVTLQGQCVHRVLLRSKEQTFDSLGLINCSKNSSNYWLVQGESGSSIKATISTKPVGSNCSGVDVATYSSWFPDPKQTVSKFRQTGQPFTSEVIASGNMLLVAFNPTAGCNLSQYSITFLQVPATACGGVLGGTNGSFMSPRYSNDHQEDIICTWNLKLQEHLGAKIFFKDLKLGRSPKPGQFCVIDYLEVNGRRFCGDHQHVCLCSKASSLQIKFHSNQTDIKGFAAGYTATDDCLTDSRCH